MAFGGHTWQQSCTQCDTTTEHGRANRAAWGCDSPTAALQFDLACPFCEGRATSCADCGGTGRLEMHRCPFALTTPEHWAIVRAVDLLDCGVLPDSGGWAEQPATAVEAIALVRKVRNRLHDDQRRRERQRAESKARR